MKTKDLREDERRRAELRRLPGVDRVLAEAADVPLGPGRLAWLVRRVLDRLRRQILAAESPDAETLSPRGVLAAAVDLASGEAAPYPRVLNATGVILHSGLGRAPLPQAAVDAICGVGRYGLLEVEREEGARRSRDHRSVELLRELTGCEDAFVVNNNAAATMIILNTLAEGREVICSRGEMVEIGGSFRIPEVMEASGARLVEVGATNRTHTRDYEAAINGESGALLVVHTSNYRIVGFASAPPLREVVEVGREHGLPVVHDLGSGSLLSPEEIGFGDEPPVGHSLKAGADVVCWSGDKLLGGPQAGIILGKREWIQKMRKNPLARALRIDKMCVAALNATLQLYLDKDRLAETHPVTRMMTAAAEELRPRAVRLASLVEGGCDARAEVVELMSETGSGALPTVQIPSIGVLLRCSAMKAPRLGRLLRRGTPSLFTRIVDNALCLDLRTLFPGEEEMAAALITKTLGEQTC